MVVDFGGGRNKHQADRADPRPPGRPSSREKQLYWLALSLHIEDLITTGEIEYYADVANQCGISRARLSNLLARRECNVSSVNSDLLL